MVNKYLKDLFPNLAKKINNAIDAVVDTAIAGVNALADGLIAGIEALADALSAVLDKILATFQEGLKAAVAIAGAVLTGDFVEALKIAIQAGCNIAGIDSKPIFDFFEKAAQNLISILKNPVGFFGNIVEAVGGGISNFAANIKKHLINGLIGWLTGALSEVQITLPDKFDFKGIFSLVMQILGLTYENIKAKIIKKYPPSEKVFDMMERGAELIGEGISLIKEVKEGGIGVLWKKAKESLANLKETVLSGIKDFVIFTVVKEGITWLLGLLNPAGAIAKVLKLLFDFVMFLIERFGQIKDFVVSVYDSIVAIASGNLGPAKKAVENSLARILPVAISLLASLAGLGGIGKTVQKIIKKVSDPVQKMLDKIIDAVIKFVKKLLSRGGRSSKKGRQDDNANANQNDNPEDNANARVDEELGESLNFRDSKENHRLWIRKSGSRNFDIMMASNDPGPLDNKIKVWQRDERVKAEKQGLLSDIIELYGSLEAKAQKELNEQIRAKLDNEVTRREAQEAEEAEEATITAEERLIRKIKELLDFLGEDFNYEMIHEKALSDSGDREILIGNGNYIRGFPSRRFTQADLNGINYVGYSTGDHTTGAMSPGRAAKEGDRAETFAEKFGFGNWTNDHQPLSSLASHGYRGTYRFYPHSESSSNRQGSVARKYVDSFKKQVSDQANWAQHVKGEWFWKPGGREIDKNSIDCPKTLTLLKGIRNIDLECGEQQAGQKAQLLESGLKGKYSAGVEYKNSRDTNGEIKNEIRKILESNEQSYNESNYKVSKQENVMNITVKDENYTIVLDITNNTVEELKALLEPYAVQGVSKTDESVIKNHDLVKKDSNVSLLKGDLSTQPALHVKDKNLKLYYNLTAEYAHDLVFKGMGSSKTKYLKGHRSFVPGHPTDNFSADEQRRVDRIGAQTGDHSTNVKHSGRRYLNHKDHGSTEDKNCARSAANCTEHWTIDHQPILTLSKHGYQGVFRFYPHSKKSSNHQGGLAKTYKNAMFRLVQKDNWAQGLQGTMYWE
jgi:hypothetical protein